MMARLTPDITPELLSLWGMSLLLLAVLVLFALNLICQICQRRRTAKQDREAARWGRLTERYREYERKYPSTSRPMRERSYGAEPKG